MRLKKFLLLFASAALASLAVSCTKEPTEPQRFVLQSEDGYVTVGVGVSVDDDGGVPTKSVITIADNDTPEFVTINNVRLGIYNSDGTLFSDEYFPTGTDLKIRLKKGDRYTIYTLVNMGPALSFPSTEDAIGNIYYSVSSLSDINTVGFPLFGPLEGTSLTAGDDPKIRVTVRNLLSKITLSLDRSALQTHNGGFTVSSLRLMNSPKGVYPFRSESKASSSADVFTGDQATATDMQALNSGSEAVFYVFENMQGDLVSDSNRDSWKKIAPDAKKNVCTYIELVGEYTTDGGALKASNTYRMYLGENEYYNFDIRRNTKKWISVVLGDFGFQKGSWKVLSDVTSDSRSLAFSPSSMTLEEGDSKQYTVTASPSGLLYDCQLSDNLKSLVEHNSSTGTLSLATAPESDVYGTLTATTWDGRKSATMDVIAKAKITKTVTSLTLSETSKTIFVDGEFTLTATAHFSDGSDEVVSCSWSSNHSNIASVDGGLVTGISAGSATITASYGGKTASCAVTVNEVGVEQVYGTPVITVTYPDIPADGSGVYPTIHVTQTVTLKYEDGRPDETADPVEVDLTYPFETTGDIRVKSFERSNGRSGTGSALSTSGNERGKASASSRGTTEGDRRAVEDVSVVVTANGKDSQSTKVTVYQAANTRTSIPATTTTNYITISLSPSSIGASGGTSTVSATRNYDSVTSGYQYSSGAVSGCAVTSGQTESISLTNITLSPSGTATRSGSTITVPSNGSTSSRSWTVTGYYGSFSDEATLYQDGKSADVVTYELFLESSSSTIEVGETLQLDAEKYEYTNGVQSDYWSSGTMNSICSWSSNNTGVASVSSSGLVTAKSTGTATITASYYENGYGSVSDNVTVKVVAASGPVVTTGHELELTGSDIEVTVGSTATVSRSAKYYTITYHDGEEYSRTSTTVSATLSSSNTTIATVSGTTVTGKKVGTTYLTGTYSGYTSTNSIEVDVVAYEPVVTYELEITPESTTLDEGESVSFVATYYTVTDGLRNGGTTVTSSATWSIYSGSSYISSTTTKGKYSWKSGGGSATVKATYNGCTAYADITTNAAPEPEDEYKIIIE